MILSVSIFPAVSEAKVSVIGTTEHEALLAKEVGGDLIDIRWLVGADIDPHRVESDSSLIPLLEKADLLLVNGEQLEAGWLATLLKEVKNKTIKPGADGYVSLSEGVALLSYSGEEFQNSSFQELLLKYGSHQEVKNHHYWLDPENSIPMIEHIRKELTRVDPSNAKQYDSNAGSVTSRLRAKIAEWDAKMAPFKGKKIISYHRSWNYLAQRHGLEIVDYIEPKEMTRPDEARFKDLARRFKNREVALVLISATERPPFVDFDRVTDLAVRLHAHTVILSESMNRSNKRADLIAYFDAIYNTLISILK
jgi:ABC-type Zn uptake system ZnuABC Zn-binding protein ZnuA